jgi:dienelactone hydrolase
MKTYVTGDSTCMTGMVYIYDMFGPDFKQTLQGADIIGSTGHVVVMPDFFRGQRFDVSNIPADTEENMAKLMAFVDGPANLGNNIKVVRELMPELKTQFPAVEKWALVGFCCGLL